MLEPWIRGHQFLDRQEDSEETCSETCSGVAIQSCIDLHNLERGLTRYEVNLCNLSEVN